MGRIISGLERLGVIDIWIPIETGPLDHLSVIITVNNLFKSLFPPNFIGIYDNIRSEHVSGLQKYDLCMTE